MKISDLTLTLKGQDCHVQVTADALVFSFFFFTKKRFLGRSWYFYLQWKYKGNEND